MGHNGGEYVLELVKAGRLARGRARSDARKAVLENIFRLRFYRHRRLCWCRNAAVFLVLIDYLKCPRHWHSTPPALLNHQPALQGRNTKNATYIPTAGHFPYPINFPISIPKKDILQLKAEVQ